MEEGVVRDVDQGKRGGKGLRGSSEDPESVWVVNDGFGREATRSRDPEEGVADCCLDGFEEEEVVEVDGNGVSGRVGGREEGSALALPLS